MGYKGHILRLTHVLFWGGRSLMGRASPSVKHTTQIHFIDTNCQFPLPLPSFLPGSHSKSGSSDPHSILCQGAIRCTQTLEIFLARKPHPLVKWDILLIAAGPVPDISILLSKKSVSSYKSDESRCNILPILE